ncbi:MAG: glycosyltransferase family 2 protein [Ginsengibacter sp.]
MKISLITVTYNSEKYLENCITSVIKQSYKNIEHIIVDGKSTDGTISIIERYAPYISKWISETDRGMYDAINKGMEMATGDVIGLLNSDDILASSDVIASIVKCFQENNTDSVYGDLEYVDQYNDEKVIRLWTGQIYKRKRFRFGWMPAHPTFYFKRELIGRFGGYESHYFTAADYELMARYLFLNKISSVYLPKLIVKMRKGGASNSNLYRRLRANRRDYLAMKKNMIPFPLVVSFLKPLRKLPQYKIYLYNLFARKKKTKVPYPGVLLFPAE